MNVVIVAGDEVGEREAPGDRLRDVGTVELIVPELPVPSGPPAEHGARGIAGAGVVATGLDLCEAGPTGHRNRNQALAVGGIAQLAAVVPAPAVSQPRVGQGAGESMAGRHRGVGVAARDQYRACRVACAVIAELSTAVPAPAVDVPGVGETAAVFPAAGQLDERVNLP